MTVVMMRQPHFTCSLHTKFEILGFFKSPEIKFTKIVLLATQLAQCDDTELWYINIS